MEEVGRPCGAPRARKTSVALSDRAYPEERGPPLALSCMLGLRGVLADLPTEARSAGWRTGETLPCGAKLPWRTVRCTGPGRGSRTMGKLWALARGDGQSEYASIFSGHTACYMQCVILVLGPPR